MSSKAEQLESLIELVEPPAQPLRTDEGNWDLLLRRVPFKFPEVFLEYGRLYGTGEFECAGYTIRVANPLDPKYPKWLEKICKWMRNMDSPEYRPSRFFPEEKGVVPFAESLGGEYLYFSSQGRTTRVVGFPGGNADVVVSFGHGFIGFLVALFTGKLEPQFFPNAKLRGARPVFRKTSWF
jgi:hypothetical protein